MDLQSESDLAEIGLQHVKAAFGSAAAKAGALFPDDVWKLIDTARVEVDEAGSPKNCEALITAVREARPEYFGASGGGGGAGNSYLRSRLRPKSQGQPRERAPVGAEAARGRADGGVRQPLPARMDANDWFRRAIARQRYVSMLGEY